MTSYFDNIGDTLRDARNGKYPTGCAYDFEALRVIEERLVWDMDLVMSIPGFPQSFRERIQSILVDGCVSTLSSYVHLPERCEADENFDPFAALADMSERLHDVFHALADQPPVRSDKPLTWIRWHTQSCDEEREKRFRELGRYKPPPGYEIQDTESES